MTISVTGKLRTYNPEEDKELLHSDNEFSCYGKFTHVHAYRVGKRRLMIDESGRLFAKCFNKWWHFPTQIEY